MKQILLQDGDQFFYLRKNAIELVTLKSPDLNLVFFKGKTKEFDLTLHDIIRGLESLYNKKEYDKDGPFSIDEIITETALIIVDETMKSLEKKGMVVSDINDGKKTYKLKENIKPQKTKEELAKDIFKDYLK